MSHKYKIHRRNSINEITPHTPAPPPRRNRTKTHDKMTERHTQFRWQNHISGRSRSRMNQIDSRHFGHPGSGTYPVETPVELNYLIAHSILRVE